MSRSKKVIDRRPEFVVIREVTLNRAGPRIGLVVRWGMTGKLAYLSQRKHQSMGARGRGHYYINERGFAVDKALLNEVITKDRIDLIVLEYEGPKGVRYFISTIDDWIMHAVPISHAKDTGKAIETYGAQMVLCEDFMDEIEIKYA